MRSLFLGSSGLGGEKGLESVDTGRKLMKVLSKMLEGPTSSCSGNLTTNPAILSVMKKGWVYHVVEIPTLMPSKMVLHQSKNPALSSSEIIRYSVWLISQKSGSKDIRVSSRIGLLDIRLIFRFGGCSSADRTVYAPDCVI